MPYCHYRFDSGPDRSARRHGVGQTVLAAVLAFVLVMLLVPAARASVTLGEVEAGSLLFATDTPGRYRPAPTVDTRVEMDVSGLIARVSVRQRFTNPGDDWVEGVYVFPLPENAAVDHMRMRVGERLIEGLIKEKAEARRTYEKAKAEGRKASLVEQERPNIFTNSVANIGPHESVEVAIEYQQTLRYDQGRFHLRFPTVVGPRYIPGAPLSTDSEVAGFDGSGWAAPTTEVPDADRITPPVVPPGHPPVNPLTLTVNLDAGFPLARVESNFHQVDIERPAPGRAVVRLADGPVPADRDFELVWEPQAGSAPGAALFTQEHRGDTYALLMVMPPQAEPEPNAERLAREVVFVIDTSGSMAGASIEQAREALAWALERLGPKDRFNVIQFNSSTSALFSDAVVADAAHKRRALRYVRGLSAGGGTEMASALKRALQGQEAGQGVRQVVFLTDGAVGNENALFGIIERRLGRSRLFTVGIGSAPNSHFMRRAATFGRGTFSHIGRVDQVQERMAELLRKLEHPVLTDIAVQWPEGSEVSMWPQRVPDLYRGEPVVVAARLPAVRGKAVVEGRAGEGRWRVTLPLTGGSKAPGVNVLWARRKIADLLDSLHRGADADAVRTEVVDTALAHHLVSRYTSLVAVDVTPSRPQGEGVDKRAVPTNLPAGWEYEKVFGHLPQTATPAPLLLLLGLLALLGGGLVWPRWQ